MTGMLVVAVIFSSMVQLVDEFGEVWDIDLPPTRARLDQSFVRLLVSGDSGVFRQAICNSWPDGEDRHAELASDQHIRLLSVLVRTFHSGGRPV